MVSVEDGAIQAGAGWGIAIEGLLEWWMAEQEGPEHINDSQTAYLEEG